jgi:hypothetical protein
VKCKALPERTIKTMPTNSSLKTKFLKGPFIRIKLYLCASVCRVALHFIVANNVKRVSKGQHMKTFKLLKMTKKEIENLMEEQLICRIAFKGEKAPYIAPFQYALVNGKMHFHFTKYGRKMQLLKKDKPVALK